MFRLARLHQPCIYLLIVAKLSCPQQDVPAFFGQCDHLNAFDRAVLPITAGVDKTGTGQVLFAQLGEVAFHLSAVAPIDRLGQIVRGADAEAAHVAKHAHLFRAKLQIDRNRRIAVPTWTNFPSAGTFSFFSRLFVTHCAFPFRMWNSHPAISGALPE
jgi:hypothetical protein